jgi:protein-disulfide isomerase
MKVRQGSQAGWALVGLLAGCSALLAMRSEIVEGNPSGTVRVVIYEDLQCSDCEKLRVLLDGQVLARYGSRVAFVHKDFPLGKHDWARQAAVAGRWVYAQDPVLGITFRREILAEHDHITVGTLKPWLVEFAARNKLDQKGILDSLNDTRLNSLVDQDYQTGIAKGVSHTPTVYVGGQAIVEMVLYDDLSRAIDHELGR